MKIFASSEDRQSLGNRFREQRFKFFDGRIKDLIAKGAIQFPIKILDVGGMESYWENRGWHNNPDYSLTLVNITFPEKSKNYTNIINVIGNAVDLNQYRDDEFDIVFSNSVIEHLYTYENQEKMAAECRRVGKYYFVQTPNRAFFLEPHYLLPFFQFLPSRLKYFILTKTRLSRGKRWNKAFAQQYIDEIRLLTRREMENLFPKAKIYVESFFGLAKSFTAHNFSV